MYIKKIKLKNFRNYEEQEIELGKNINIFYGDNAQGKTNIIESIFLCSIGKSFRTSKDKELIQFNKEMCSSFIEFEKSDRDGSVKVDISNKKSIFVNGVKIKKLSELLGNLNIVIFTPDDILILKEGPDKRRRFLDVMISQLRPNYVNCLNLYKQTLEQRNNYLKQIREENKPEEMLEIWDEKLAEYGEKIRRVGHFELRGHTGDDRCGGLRRGADCCGRPPGNAAHSRHGRSERHVRRGRREPGGRTGP